MKTISGNVSKLGHRNIKFYGACSETNIPQTIDIMARFTAKLIIHGSPDFGKYWDIWGEARQESQEGFANAEK